jgi:hypothetical protein
MSAANLGSDCKGLIDRGGSRSLAKDRRPVTARSDEAMLTESGDLAQDFPPS